MQRTLVKGLVMATLVSLLAGCSGPAGDEGAAEPSGPAATTTAPPSSGPPAVDPALENVPVVGESRTAFNLTGCLNPRMLFVLDPEAAQALLPPPFVAADVTGLAQFTGLGVESPMAAGRAVGGYDFLSCASSTLAPGPASFSQVGIMVQPPNLGDRTPLEPASFDLYLLALPTDSPAWQALLMASGFQAAEVPTALVVSETQDPGADNHVGAGSVSTEAGAIASAAYALPATGRDLELQGRYWHLGEAGTFYMDFHLREDVRAGPITSCVHAAGSVYASVAGTEACAMEPRFAAVGLGTQVAGTAYWLPGVFPAAS